MVSCPCLLSMTFQLSDSKFTASVSNSRRLMPSVVLSKADFGRESRIVLFSGKGGGSAPGSALLGDIKINVKQRATRGDLFIGRFFVGVSLRGLQRTSKVTHPLPRGDLRLFFKRYSCQNATLNGGEWVDVHRLVRLASLYGAVRLSLMLQAPKVRLMMVLELQQH